MRIDTDSDGLISLPSVTTSQILPFLTPELLQQFPPGVIEQLSPQEVVELIPELLYQLPPDLVDQLTPVVIEQLTSRSGRGFALDFGAGIVHDNWELGFGANGVGNRIKWEEFKLKQFTLASLLVDAGFADRRLPPPTGSIDVKLPVRYSGNGAYHWENWSALVDLGYGFENFSFHGGTEYRFSRIEFRGGARYSRKRWQPTGGIGLNLTQRLAFDAALFGTSSNVERIREMSVALSLRIRPGDSGP